MSVAFVDTETTGLDPGRHEIWELAIITEKSEVEYQLPVDLARADPMGLRIGRFYERRSALRPWVDHVAKVSRSRWKGDEKWTQTPVADIAGSVAQMLDGAHIVGAVPSFDAAFLTPWLRANGHAPTWHYHLIDVEALAAGYIAGCREAVDAATVLTGEAAWAGTKAWAATEGPDPRPPWNSNDLSLTVGVDPGDFDRHTALGDARWAKAIYEAVLGA